MIERLINVFKGCMRLFVSRVEQDNPEALLANEKENLRHQIGRFNEGLVSHAALCERLIDQVKKLEHEDDELRVRTGAQLKAGNRRAAAELALRLQTVSRELGENRKQAEEAEVTYRDLVLARDAAVESARRKIEQLRRGIDEMRIQQAMADLNQMAAGLMTSVGGTGETLARLEEMIEEQRSHAAGTTRVMREHINASDLALREAEHDALAERALADFAAREGITLEAVSAEAGDSAPGSKRMGPIQSGQSTEGPIENQ